MQVGRRLRGCAYFLNAWDLEGAVGKRSWTSERGLGVAWTHFEAPGDVRGEFRRRLKRLGTSAADLGSRFDVIGASWRLRGARHDKR